jgi:hypothetical protein
MKAEYIRLIANHDKTLSQLASCLKEAKTPEDIKKWKDRINESLDERIILMKSRDAA